MKATKDRMEEKKLWRLPLGIPHFFDGMRSKRPMVPNFTGPFARFTWQNFATPIILYIGKLPQL